MKGPISEFGFWGRLWRNTGKGISYV